MNCTRQEVLEEYIDIDAVYQLSVHWSGGWVYLGVGLPGGGSTRGWSPVGLPGVGLPGVGLPGGWVYPAPGVGLPGGLVVYLDYASDSNVLPGNAAPNQVPRYFTLHSSGYPPCLVTFLRDYLLQTDLQIRVGR